MTPVELYMVVHGPGTDARDYYPSMNPAQQAGWEKLAKHVTLLRARNEGALLCVQACRNFVAKVDAGLAKSRASYKEMKEALDIYDGIVAQTNSKPKSAPKAAPHKFQLEDVVRLKEGAMRRGRKVDPLRTGVVKLLRDRYAYVLWTGNQYPQPLTLDRLELAK